MRNLNLKEPRCRGADTARAPTICPLRNSCRRHLQLQRDRDLELPAEVKLGMRTMNLAYVPGNECSYFLGDDQ